MTTLITFFDPFQILTTVVHLKYGMCSQFHENKCYE